MLGELLKIICGDIVFFLTLSNDFMSDTEKGSVWDLWAMDWVQRRAECMRYCLGRTISPAGQAPVSEDIQYEFDSRNPYNYLQVTYYKVFSCVEMRSQVRVQSWTQVLWPDEPLGDFQEHIHICKYIHLCMFLFTVLKFSSKR